MALITDDRMAMLTSHVTPAMRTYAAEWMGDAQWFENFLRGATACDVHEPIPADVWWEWIFERLPPGAGARAA